MYDSISNMMGEEKYPEDWWMERVECLENMDPKMNAILEKAWDGMLSFWEAGGQEEDPWHDCEATKWFESNCTSQPGVGLAIWEPCNYATNLAYDRLGSHFITCIQLGVWLCIDAWKSNKAWGLSRSHE